MKHRRGIDLVGGSDTAYVVGEGSRRGSAGSTEHTYRVEVWMDEPEAGGELLETISRSTDFSVTCAALNAAIRARPGKFLVHLNARHRISAPKGSRIP